MSALLFTLFGVQSAIEFDCTSDEKHSLRAKASEHEIEDNSPLIDHVKVELGKLSITGIITNTPVTASAIELITSTGTFKLVAPVTGRQVLQQLTIPPAAQGELGASISTSIFSRGASISGGTVLPVPRIGPVKPEPTPIRVNPAQRLKVPSNQELRATGFDVGDRVKQVDSALQLLVQTSTPVRVLTTLREYPLMVIEDFSVDQRPEDALHFSLELKQVRYATVSTTTIRARNTDKPRNKEEAPVVASAPPPTTLPPLDQEKLKSYYAHALDAATGD